MFNATPLNLICSVRMGICALCVLLSLACGDNSKSGFDVAVEATILRSNAPVEIGFRALTQAPLQAELSYNWSFGDGETSTEAEPTHRFEQAGEFQVTVEVNASTGGTGRANILVSLGDATNLAVQNVQVGSNVVAPDEELEVTWLLSNLGAEARNDFGVGLYLSEDQTFDSGDVFLKRESVSQGSVTSDGLGQATTIVIPADARGDMFVLVVADDRALIGDADRSNNVGVSPTVLRIRGENDSGPDLVVCGLNIDGIDELETDSQAVVEQTDQLALDVCLSNVGDRPATVVRYSIFLSRDESLDDEDLLIAERQAEALGLGDRVTLPETIDFSVAEAGVNWHVIVAVDPDDQLDEQREDNNVATFRRSFEVVAGGMVEGVDLLVSSVTVAQTRVFWGQLLSGELVLQNRGSIAVERIFLVRVSLKPADGGPSVPLTSLNLDGIGAGSSRTESFELTLSERIGAGQYTLVAEVDPTNSVGDVNEANNRRFFNTPLELGGAPNIDLTPESVEPSATQVQAGEMLTVRMRLANSGLDSSGPFDVNVILSRDNAASVDDVILATVRVPNLDGSSNTEIEENVVIPVDVDQAVNPWLIGVDVDPENRVRNEVREDNNVRFSPTQLEVVGATGGCREDDFEPNNVRSAATPLMGMNLENLGACANADWFSIDLEGNQVLQVNVSERTNTSSMRLRLVDNLGQTITEASVGTRTLSTFHWTSAGGEQVFLEVTAGNAEVAYDLSYTLQDRPMGGVLMARDVRVQPAIAQPGQDVQVVGNLVNVGVGSMDASAVGFFGGDSPGTLGSTFLASEAVPSLEAGDIHPFTKNVGLPAALADGPYFISIKPDVEGVGMEEIVGAEDWFRLVIDQDGACTADEFEPNQSPHLLAGTGNAIAQPILPGVYSDLSVCSSDDDWYAVALEAGQRLDASVTYAVAQGDIELSLYNSDGLTIIDQSTSLLGTESVELARVTQGGLYYLRVFLKDGGAERENTYTLETSVGDADACPDDSYEPNLNRTTAPLLRDGTHDLYLCESDEDWFRFAIAAGNTVSWQLTSGDAPLRMLLFDESGLVGESDRRIVHQARRNGTHYLQVIADIPGEYAYQIRSSGVSGVDLALVDISSSRSSVSPGMGFRVSGQVENRRGDFASNVYVQAYLTTDLSNYESGLLLGETRISRVDGAALEAFSMRVSVPSESALEANGINIPSEAHVVGVVDPERLIADAQFSNNISSTTLAVTQGCVDDDENSNEGASTATELGDFTNGLERRATICAYTEDWYAVSLVSELTLSISLTEFEGDLDLAVYDDSGALLANSASESSIERVELNLDPSQTPRILIRVDGFEESQSAYRLFLEESQP